MKVIVVLISINCYKIVFTPLFFFKEKKITTEIQFSASQWYSNEIYFRFFFVNSESPSTSKALQTQYISKKEFSYILFLFVLYFHDFRKNILSFRLKCHFHNQCFIVFLCFYWNSTDITKLMAKLTKVFFRQLPLSR